MLSAPDGVRARYERDGYVVLRALFDRARTARIGAWIDALAAAREAPGGAMVYREDSLLEPGSRVLQRIENFCPFHPDLDQLARTRPLLELAGALLGEPAVLFKDKINFKLPGGGGFAPHQDQQAGWSRYCPLFVTALVAIDPMTVENGCLEIARTRAGGALIGAEWEPLDARALSGIALEPLLAEPGDVVLFDSFVPHGSQPNRTDAARRVLYLTYNRARDGDHRAAYFAEKRAAFPPDAERDPAATYVFRV